MFSFVRLQVLVLKKPELKGKMVEMDILKKEKHSEWLTEKLSAAVFVCLCAFISRVVWGVLELNLLLHRLSFSPTAWMWCSYDGVLQRRAEAGAGDGQSCPEPVMASWLLSEGMDMTDWRPIPPAQSPDFTPSAACLTLGQECEIHSVFTGLLIMRETTYTQESAVIVWANQICTTFFRSCTWRVCQRADERHHSC